MIFQNSLIQSLIHKIKKNIKISGIFWQVQIDDIENKISKIIKNKKTNSKSQNFDKKHISHQYFFQKNFQKFPEIVRKISNPSNKTPQKIP